MLHQPAVKTPRQSATFRHPERPHTPAIRAAATSCFHLHHEQSSLGETLLPHQEIQLAKATTPPLSERPPTASLQQAAHLLLSPQARVVVMDRTSHKRPSPNKKKHSPTRHQRQRFTRLRRDDLQIAHLLPSPEGWWRSPATPRESDRARSTKPGLDQLPTPRS